MILNKLARYALILLIVIVCAIQLPFFYYKSVHKPGGNPRIYYSPIINDFVIMQHENGRMNFSDNQGNKYNRRNFEKILPFQFYRDLSKWGVLPDSINGLPIDASVIHHNSTRYKIKGKNLDLPEIKLYPLFESESDFAQLQFPANFFRINDKIEFITASKNKINEELSEKFNSALVAAGFKFPAKIIAGLPTTKKPFDEGYFIVDNANIVFHMKKAKGEPVIVKTPISQDLDIRKIVIQETVTQKIYGFLVTNKDEVFMISYDNYKLLPIELDNFVADKMDLTIAVDPLFVNFTYDDNYNFYASACDTNYKQIDKIKIAMTPKEEKLSEKIKYALFPFSIKTSSSFSSLKHFDFHLHSSLSFIGIILSLIIGFMVKVNRREDIKSSWFDFVIIAFTGVYGLLGVIFIKTDIWD